jgi:hypothetical protein
MDIKEPPSLQFVAAIGTAALVWALATAVCSCNAAPEEIPEQEVLDSFRALHTHIYDVYAVEFDRDAVYDLLAESFAGDALVKEYVEHYTTKWRMTHDDTRVTILRVDYADTQVVQRLADRTVVEADWNVGGVVYHQGHTHARINRYQAAYTLADGDDGLRIVDTRMKDMERVRLDMMSGGNLGLDQPLPTSGQGMLSPSDLLKAGMLPSTPEEGEEPSEEATP